MATMNPLNSYHDPALDILVHDPNKPRRNSSAHKSSAGRPRRTDPDGYINESTMNGRPPPAPDAPLGAPISYRGVGPDADSGLHRSFSQRAKGKSLPFAQEAFDEDELAGMELGAQPRQTSRSSRSHGGYQSSRSTATYQANGGDEHDDDLEDVSQEPLANAAMPQRQESSNTRTPSQSHPQPQPQSEVASRSQSNPQPQPEPQTPELSPAPIASFYRSATLRDAPTQTEEQRQDWASDRSPLQKLEVKLTDISKEEKRARVQEAEMKLMKDKNIPIPDRSRRSNMSTSRTPAQSARAAPEHQDAAQAYSLGGHQGSRRVSDKAGRSQVPQNAMRESSGSRSNRPSDNGRRNGDQPRDYFTSDASAASQFEPTGYQAPRVHDSRVRDPNRGSSARQAPIERTMTDASQPHVARAVSLQQPKPSGRSREEDRPMGQHERNASRQAALEQLTAQDHPQRAKSGSRKLQKSPPQNRNSGRFAEPTTQAGGPVVDLSSMSGGDPGFDSPRQRTSKDVQGRHLPPQRDQQYQSQPQPQRNQPGVGLGLQQPSALRSTDSPPVSSTDITKQRSRKGSVTFKEPFDRRRPTDEWKEADTARLMLDDFSTEESNAPKSDKAWWEENKSKSRRSSQSRTAGGLQQEESIDDRTAQFKPHLYIKCGPLLRYAGLKRTKGDDPSTPSAEFWRGSVMIVTQDSQCSYEQTPTLRLFSQPKKLLPPPPAHVTAEQLTPEYIDPIAGLTKLGRTGRARYVRPIDHIDEEKDLSQIEDDDGIYEASPSPLYGTDSKDAASPANNKRTLSADGETLGRYKEVRGVRLYADPERDVTFWRFNIEVELATEQHHIAYRINKGASVGFWVPAKGHTMNMMFHTCNGFSMSVDPNAFSGPDPMWRDVLNNHQTRPFHVMIGGGDQIYNDRVMVDTHHFADWTAIKNPHHKHEVPFSSEMKEELETFYLDRYCMWFSQGLFAMANASIPMINIWDDHDIIDGFGSYPHEFMRTPVFSGLGNIAYKYYLLFQHQSIEAMTDKDEPSWVLGHAPGPYIHSRSRSLYLELGQSVAFLGIDCRTERTKNDVLSIDTLEIILDRCRREMVEGQTKHLIVLLGVPIAYPRLVWLENVLTSKAMDPIKALGRAGILKTKMLNRFDGGVEILDDLDDHWTASHHKDERNILIQELQDLAAEKSARVTILGGDVHLAAIGQFYSNPKLKIPKDRDHRYMPNVVSSAIVNTPPPEFMADVLNKRNKVHHLDKYTDENMIPMFSHDVNGKKRNNNHLLPRRNWCSIREYRPGATPPPSPPSTPSVSSDEEEGEMPGEYSEKEGPEEPKRRASFTKNNFNPRNLMRRLSSRRQDPPSSYKTEQGSGRPPQARAASFDGADFGRKQQEQRQQGSQGRTASADSLSDTRGFNRPTFHRRPTNLSEKAARKGNVMAVDDEGNEFDINDQVNLEGGLDVSINCEIDQKDPAGITTSYRLLIPALWYDGSSDREKINDPAPVGRKNSVFQRFGLGARKNSSAADNQGQGNWGQETSENESHDESEKKQREKPKRSLSLSLFGSKRKKNESNIDEGYYEKMAADASTKQRSQDQSHDNHDSMFSGMKKHQDHDRSYDTPNSTEHERRSTPRSNQRQQQQPEPNTSSGRPNIGSQRNSRPASYTIGGSAPIHPQPTSPQQPYDADAAYIDAQRAQEARYKQIMQSRPQDTQSSRPIAPQRQSSKVERILGIGSAADTGFNQPNQRQLRGNGIIGRNISPSNSPSRNNSNNNNHHRHSQSQSRSQSQSQQEGNNSRQHSQHHHHHDQNNGNTSRDQNQNQHQNQRNDENLPPGAYSGIEAYKEPKNKNKRTWSLSIKDRAKGLLESVEGKRGKQDEDLYSDEDDDEEQSWEEDEEGVGSYQRRQSQQGQQQRPEEYQQGRQRQHQSQYAEPGQQYQGNSGGGSQKRRY